MLLFQVGQPAVVEFTGGYKNNELKITEGDTAKVSLFLLLCQCNRKALLASYTYH